MKLKSILLIFVALLRKREVACPSASMELVSCQEENGDIQQLPPSWLCLHNPLIMQNKLVPCHLPVPLMPPIFLSLLKDIYMKTSLFLESLFFLLFLRATLPLKILTFVSHLRRMGLYCSAFNNTGQLLGKHVTSMEGSELK